MIISDLIYNYYMLNPDISLKIYLSYKKQTHKMGKICLLKINIKLNDYK